MVELWFTGGATQSLCVPPSRHSLTRQLLAALSRRVGTVLGASDPLVATKAEISAPLEHMFQKGRQITDMMGK